LERKENSSSEERESSEERGPTSLAASTFVFPPWIGRGRVLRRASSRLDLTAPVVGEEGWWFDLEGEMGKLLVGNCRWDEVLASSRKSEGKRDEDQQEPDPVLAPDPIKVCSQVRTSISNDWTSGVDLENFFSLSPSSSTSSGTGSDPLLLPPQISLAELLTEDLGGLLEAVLV